jgi:hypothetical protein
MNQYGSPAKSKNTSRPASVECFEIDQMHESLHGSRFEVPYKAKKKIGAIHIPTS